METSPTDQRGSAAVKRHINKGAIKGRPAWCVCVCVSPVKGLLLRTNFISIFLMALFQTAEEAGSFPLA